MVPGYSANKKNWLPGPFSLAVTLTLLVLLYAFLFLKPAGQQQISHGGAVLKWWYQGMWSAPQLVFAFQMLLILILGHSLALSPPAQRIMAHAASMVRTNAQAAAVVCSLALVFGFINWGLTLIFGAVFARFIAFHAQSKGMAINYPLIAASGYTGMMVWHGGLSGSALLKSAEPGHLAGFAHVNPAIAALNLPEQLLLRDTVFTSMNLTAAIALLVALPLTAFLLGKHDIKVKVPDDGDFHVESTQVFDPNDPLHPFWRRPAYALGVLVLLVAFALLLIPAEDGADLATGPNYINMWLLGLALFAHGSLARFSNSLREGMQGATGIVIQFPLYFGIMGVMQSSGMGAAIADFFVSISSKETFPFLTFLSSGLLNMLIPSGGGQWMIQAPILLEATGRMDADLSGSILAFAYGDQITNMLQPFWALPLLGITGLKAGQILPYTLKFMMVGVGIFLLVLWLF